MWESSTKIRAEIDRHLGFRSCPLPSRPCSQLPNPILDVPTHRVLIHIRHYGNQVLHSDVVSEECVFDQPGCDKSELRKEYMVNVRGYGYAFYCPNSVCRR